MILADTIKEENRVLTKHLPTIMFASRDCGPA